MADLSDVVTDPDFVTTFQVETQSETIGQDGRARFDATMVNVVGTVVPDGESLKRQPDGSRLSGSIKVYTAAALSSGSGARHADIVIWSGARYTVMAVSDFSRWDGLRVASCELIPFSR